MSRNRLWNDLWAPTLNRTHFTAIIIALVCVLPIVVFKLAFILDGLPYRMVLRPSGRHAVVRFMQADRRLITEEIPVDVEVSATIDVELTGRQAPIKGVTIDFYDPGPLPGCFRMRIGTTKLEIMEASYVVNGERRSWIHQ